MIKWLLGRKIRAFESEFDYDASYMRDLLQAVGAKGLMRFARLQGLGTFNQGVPEEAWYLARVVAGALADCGPCAQLVVTMALRAGVPGEAVTAALSGDDAALSADARAAVAFVRATMARAPEADEHRDEVVRRFGRAGLVTLAYAVTAARLYPTLKFALGHGKACQRVQVGNTSVVPQAALATA